MARYLPHSYEPIPDALLWSKADLVDVTRRISRNQNWIWANHGNVLAAFGHEPMTTQTPTVTTGTVDAAYFACPNRSATGSDSVRCRGYVTVVTGSANAKLRLYQLLPGEAIPTADTPYDETALSTAGTDVFFDFNARIRSGADPLRFCLRLIGASVGTYTLLSCTVTWLPNPTSVLGESVAAWEAISQGYAVADRALSAPFLRAISNRTIRLMTENPRPIFAHSFLWPRISTAAAGAETRVALYTIRHDGISTPQLAAAGRFFVTGQNAIVTSRIYVNGVLFGSHTSSAVGLVDSVYVGEFQFFLSALAVPAGDLKIEVTEQCTTGATAPPTYCTNVGAVWLSLMMRQIDRGSSDLGLPGTETIPAAYEPLDDNACAPGRSVVAQNDRLGRRAGPYYLVRNMIWLAGNRTAHVLIADWTHRTQSAGRGTAVAGDGFYRSETLIGSGQSWASDLDQLPWADRPNPTNVNGIASGGHHFRGDVLGRFYETPLNGGKLAAILRPDGLYIPEAPGFGEESHQIVARSGTTVAGVHGLQPSQVIGGFQWQLYGLAAALGTIFSFRGNSNPKTTVRPIGSFAAAFGNQIALNGAYVYEQPLTQTDLDALA
jgi:hypothetical protein